jgi:hypothetical protein
MKNIIKKSIKKILLFSIFFSLFSTFGQAPQKMSYQAVIRNSSNVLIASTSVTVKVSVLLGTANGTVVYSEVHLVATNNNGLATFNIGTGTVLFGDFAAINWANGNYFVKTETDPTAGTNYTIVGTSQLTSVPYALSSLDNKWDNNPNGINYNFANVGIGTNTPNAKLTISTNQPIDLLKLKSTQSSTQMIMDDSGPNDVYLSSELGNFDIWTGGNNKRLSILTNGNVGIGISNPGYILDLSKRMRLRSESATLGAGIWFNNNTNSAENIFLGNDLSNNLQVYSQVQSRTIANFNPTTGGFRVEGPNVSTPAAKSLSVGGFGKIEVDAQGIIGGRLAVLENGNTGIGTNTPTTKLEVNGFTKSGSNAPAVKVLKLTGTTASFEGGEVNVLHNLDASKIISVTVMVSGNTSPGEWVPASYTYTPGFEYNYYIFPNQVRVSLKPTNSISILSKPFKVMITYEE